ncbi:hypothetical protein BDP27DRAFT_1434108 [Rhodocollybia butyracea]|uniref:Secreted protein n=1 Tax=Rhodocollybia butyracea TaxID=206335 RepID=A0A9P5TX07_9AGAR|nr:hypothetical protein BDP27DRAFT_1434108 [Rhodocollybia butyracea]
MVYSRSVITAILAVGVVSSVLAFPVPGAPASSLSIAGTTPGSLTPPSTGSDALVRRGDKRKQEGPQWDSKDHKRPNNGHGDPVAPPPSPIANPQVPDGQVPSPFSLQQLEEQLNGHMHNSKHYSPGATDPPAKPLRRREHEEHRISSLSGAARRALYGDDLD